MYKSRRYRSGGLRSSVSTPSKSEDKSTKVLATIDSNIPSKKQKADNQSPLDLNEDDFLLSQASVPPSQPPTQRRYLSQRSNLGQTQLSKTRAPSSFFEVVLLRSGVDLDQPNTLSISCSDERISFIDMITNMLNKDSEGLQNSKKFVEGFLDALGQKSNAMKFLSTYGIKIPNTESCMQSQISMTGTFLMVNILQKLITEVLLEKVDFYASNEEKNVGDLSILPLYLFNLRYVPSEYSELVYTQITSIFQKATVESRRDIISNAEYILDPHRHDDFVEFLLEKVSTKKELFNSRTLDTFTYLHLSSRIQKKLRRKIIRYMREEHPVSLLPLFTKFLLGTAGDDEAVLAELISDLHSTFTWDQYKSDHLEKIQLDTFKHIKQSLMISKKLSDVWQKIIRDLPSIEFNSTDFIILLILMTIRKEKCLYIQNILCRRIKMEQLTSHIISLTKNCLHSVLHEYINILLEILYSFLKDKNPLVSNFAKGSYAILFEMNENAQKKIVSKLVDLACDKTISNLTAPLEILEDLNKKHTNHLQTWGMLLLPLLDQLDEMSISQTRLVMKLLSSITYPKPPLQACEPLKDHIEKIVQKQIISRNVLTKKQGIIGMVQLIDKASRTETTSDDNIYDIDITFNSMADLPEGRGKLVANYVGLILSATRHCPDSLAFFYDELADIFSLRQKQRKSNSLKIERNFFIWLLNLVTYFFENNFIGLEEKSKTLNGIEISCQKCINLPEECSSEAGKIAINIFGLVFNYSVDASTSITVLAPLLHLLRILNLIRSKGTLESIDALLGCSLMLPAPFENYSNSDIFEEYDEAVAKKIVDIHFYTVNWYREIISAFTNQDDSSYRRKVLLRLADLISIEEAIKNLISKTPNNYTPPLPELYACKTQAPVFKKPGLPPKKAQSKEKDQNVSAVNQTIKATQKTKSSSRNDFEISYGPREIYRAIDSDIMLLLKEDLCLKHPMPDELEGKSLSLLQFRFIVYDLIHKLDFSVGVHKQNNHQTSAHFASNESLLYEVVEILPYLLRHYNEISKEINSIVKTHSGSLGDPKLFTDEMNFMKVCYGLCLKLLTNIFSWSGFQDDEHSDLLRSALQSIYKYALSTNTAEKNNSELVAESIEVFLSYEEQMIDLKSSVNMYNFLIAIKKYTKKSFDSQFRNLCRKFLCRNWYGLNGALEKSAIANENLNELIKGFLKNLTVKKLKSFIDYLPEQISKMKKKTDSLEIFPHINKLNFPILFKGVCETFIAGVDKNSSSAKNIDEWQESCDTLNVLLEIVKSMDVPRNLTIFFTYSQFYLKIFLQYGMPVVEASLCKKPEQATHLLKTLQQTTRFLHCLCCHSKVIKHTGIVTRIPALRESMENLTFRVKAALAVNNCSSAFWMGNLRNKDLQGDLILSQTSSLTREEDDDEQAAELPIDEDIFPDDDINADDSNLDQLSSREMAF